MTAGKQRLTSRPWARAIAAPGLGILAGMLLLAASSCAQRSLVEVNVTGDSAFQAVTLRLIAGGTSKDFPNASFDVAAPFKAGLYLSDSVSGSVTVVANVLGSGGACIGAGQATATGVASGAASGPVELIVTHTSNCATTATGTGGVSGGGTGGSSGGTGGAPGGGTGGSSGGGTGGASGGGTGGSSSGGTGGASGGGTNLVTNGDFSNGVTGWGLPAMAGTVSAPAVTNGALCITLGAGASATIGYPSGSVPAFQINGGTSYTFSYQASNSNAGSASVEAKVGQTMPPYDATGSDWMNDSIGTSLTTLTHTFTRGSTDASMGVAFNVTGVGSPVTGGPVTVCIDNVSLTAN